MKATQAAIHPSLIQTRQAQEKLVASRPTVWPKWLQQVFRFLTSKEQIKVTQKFDCDGNVYYEISDLVSGQTKIFDSRETAIDWLEKGRP